MVQVNERQYTHQSCQWRYQWLPPTLTFPINVVPISAKFNAGYFLPDHSEGTADVVPPPIIDQPPWEDWMLRGYQRTTSLWEIAESIWQGNTIVGTNGSAANYHGTYSFVILTYITNKSPTLSVKCGGNLPTLAEYIDMDSHCQKGVAIFSTLFFVCLLLTKYPRGPTTGVVPKLQFVLDNKSITEDDLEWTYGQETSMFDYLKSDYDLL
jgi:hypothetical protein